MPDGKNSMSKEDIQEIWTGKLKNNPMTPQEILQKFDEKFGTDQYGGVHPVRQPLIKHFIINQNIARLEAEIKDMEKILEVGQDTTAYILRANKISELKQWQEINI